MRGTKTGTGTGVDSAGIGTAFHANPATAYTAGPGNGSPRSSASNNWSVGDYYQFQVNLTNQGNSNDIVVTASISAIGPGPKYLKLQYSVNGTTFVDYQNVSVANVPPWLVGADNSASDLTVDLGSTVS